ncbi:TRAP transporter small permease [Vibrio sp. WXL103]|uniref:TRAP transporter small permease n=1 Tax=Vibrio sp. WXL103 TaxID=3450710 RepID=UPI003EC4D704
MNKYFSNKYSIFFTSLSIGCLSINVITLLGGVFSRYFLGSSPIWVDELSRYLIIGGVMLIAGIVLLNGEHMRLNLVDRLASEKIKRVIYIYQGLVVTVVLGSVAYFSYTYALSIVKFTTIGLGISKSIPMFSLPIGFGSLFLCSLYGLVQQVLQLRKGSPVAREVS